MTAGFKTPSLFLSFMTWGLVPVQHLNAATLYWDINGTTAGSGNAGGTWDTGTTANWNTLADGTGSSSVFADGDTAIISAGTDGTSAWTVTVSGTVTPGAITFEENGSKTLSGGSISTASNLTITSSGRPTSDSYTISSLLTGTGNLSLAANGDTSNTGGAVGGALILNNGSNNFTGNVNVTAGLVGFVNDGAFGNASNVITLSGGGLVAQGTRVLNHNIALSGGGDRIFRCYGGNTFTLNGTVTGSGNIRKTDNGTLQISGGTSFTGGILNYSGTVAFSGTNTYSGSTFLSSSTTIRLDSDNTLPDGTDILCYGGATFNVNGKNETIGGLMVGSASDTNVTVNLGASGATGTLTITDTTYSTAGFTNAGGNFYGKITGFGSLGYNHSTNSQANWDLLNTANDFTGNIIITSGRLRTALNAGAGAFGNANNDLVFNGEIVTTLGNGEGKASLQGAAGGTLNLAATRDIILNNGKEGTLYVWGGNTYTINGKITGGGNLRKEDSGILLLMNTANDYTGLTRIASGILKLGASGVISDSSGVELSSGTLDTGNFAETVASLSSKGGTGGTVSGGNTLTVKTAGSSNFSGVLSGTKLSMEGTGTQTLSGSSDNTTATVNVSSGVLVLAKASSASVHAIGGSGVGVTISGGTLKLAGTGGDQIYHDTIVNQTGGTFDLNSTHEGFRGLTGTGGTVTNNGSTTSTLTVGETLITNGTYTYSGSITNGSGSTAFTKTGGGTQVLNGTNTYTGTTTISGGTLKLGASGSISSSSLIIVGASSTLDVTSLTGGWTVGSSQTLSGVGTVNGDVLVDGDVRIGSSPGTMNFGGNLQLNSNSDWFVEIGGTSLTDFDRAIGTGSLTTSGNILINLINSFNPTSGDSFQIADFASYNTASVNFDFSNANLNPGLSWDTSQFSTTGTISVIPEPDFALLGMMSLIGFAFKRRR